MRIGDAAAAAGTTPRALRYYEQRGLLDPPPRTASGQRVYGPGDVARVRVIRDLLADGLTVDDVLACADRLHLLLEPGTAGEAGPNAMSVVDRRLAVLDEEIGRLTALREGLVKRVTGCGGRRADAAPGSVTGADAARPVR